MAELLDDLDFENRKIENGSHLLPLILLWIGMILSWLFGLGMEARYLFGLLLLVTTTVVAFKNRKRGIYLQGISVFLGLSSLAAYFPITGGFGIWIEEIFLGLDLFMIPIALLFAYLNWKEFSPQVNQALYGDEKYQAMQSRNSLQGFKHRFRHKTEPELEEIIRNDRIVPDARAAAAELLQELKADK